MNTGFKIKTIDEDKSNVFLAFLVLKNYLNLGIIQIISAIKNGRIILYFSFN